MNVLGAALLVEQLGHVLEQRVELSSSLLSLLALGGWRPS